MSPDFRNRIIDVRQVAASELIPNARNWRTHPQAQATALRAVLEDIGLIDVVIARQDGDRLVLIDGHLRQELSSPDQLLHVVVTDLTEEEADVALLTHDSLTSMAEANRTAVLKLMDGMGERRANLAALVAEIRERQHLARERVALKDPDATPDAPAELLTRLGDLWLLGDHRLLCGDATKTDDVARLMEDERAAMMFTDPPYGVSYGAAGAGGKNAISGDLSQAMIPISFAVAITSALDANARLYLCGGSHNFEMYSKLFDHHLHQQPHPLIWVKEAFVMRPNNYHSQFEVVYFGWKGSGGGSLFWFGDRKSSDVWQFNRDPNPVHPTQKPVALIERAIGNSAPEGALVFEPFCGSGSTMIAAERLARRCYAMEIEPRYVDVAVRRWEEFTGQKAKKLS